MAVIKSKNINAGDPVTSELINNIILDLNEINKGSSVSNIALSNTTAAGSSVSVSPKVYSTTISGVSVVVKNNPSATRSWTFPTGVFTKPPRCWIQLNTVGLSGVTEAQTRVHVHITSVSSTKVTFEVRSGNGAANAKLNFDVFAVEA